MLLYLCCRREGGNWKSCCWRQGDIGQAGTRHHQVPQPLVLPLRSSRCSRATWTPEGLLALRASPVRQMETGIKPDPNGQNSGRNPDIPDILHIWEKSDLQGRSLEQRLSEQSQVRGSEPDSDHPFRAMCPSPGILGWHPRLVMGCREVKNIFKALNKIPRWKQVYFFNENNLTKHPSTKCFVFYFWECRKDLRRPPQKKRNAKTISPKCQRYSDLLGKNKEDGNICTGGEQRSLSGVSCKGICRFAMQEQTKKTPQTSEAKGVCIKEPFPWALPASGHQQLQWDPCVASTLCLEVAYFSWICLTSLWSQACWALAHYNMRDSMARIIGVLSLLLSPFNTSLPVPKHLDLGWKEPYRSKQRISAPNLKYPLWAELCPHLWLHVEAQ